MKELSIEEKAKRYDEAIERAKGMHKEGMMPERIEYIFPELKESGDEKIRKELFEAFQSAEDSLYLVLTPQKRNRILAWLEKQKEQKPVESEPFEIEHGKYYYCIHDYYSGGNKRASKGDVVQALRGMSMMALGDRAGEYFLPANYIEQKTVEWSKEDETIKRNISHIIRQYDKISKRNNQPYWYVGDCLLWMQNIKERVQAQPKQEWNKEDESLLYNIIKDIEQLQSASKIEQLSDIYSKEIDWLKSIKDKIRSSINEKSIPSKEFVLNVWMLGNEWKDITKGVFDTEHGTQLDYILKHWKEGDYYDKIKPQSYWKLSEAKSETKNKCPNYSEGYGCSTSPLKQCNTCPDYKLYNHWKPSEEQMETLGKYVRCTVKEDHEHLEAIYNHLKN